MNVSLPKLDRTAALIALKTCLAIIIYLAIALRLDWKSSYGMILCLVLQAPAVGATFKKGLLYIAGTLSGAIFGLAIVGLFAHDRDAFLVAAALVTGFGLYRQLTSRLNAYPSQRNPGELYELLVQMSSVPAHSSDTLLTFSSAGRQSVISATTLAGLFRNGTRASMKAATCGSLGTRTYKLMT